MKIERTSIDGISVIRLDVKKDSRGLFIKPYSFLKGELKDEFGPVKEVFYSLSSKNVIRGMHFQCSPYSQRKIVTVLNGSILDVVVDIRKNSKTYGKCFQIELRAHDGNALLISDGLAHGFLSLSDDTIILYIANKEYSSKHEGGIRYDSFGFNWHVDAPIVSIRDEELEEFGDFKTPF